MKDTNNSNDCTFHDRRCHKESNRLCPERKCNHFVCNDEHEFYNKYGKDICINNNPVIKVCVNDSQCAAETPRPFLSSYMESLGTQQTIPRNGNIVFDNGSVDSVGNNIELDASGTIFTIHRTGLYHVEWNLNLAQSTTSAVVGIMENGEPASGSATVTGGNFSSGTIIYVDSVPFTLSLYNYNGEITIEDINPYGDSAASIRIVRFADGPSE